MLQFIIMILIFVIISTVVGSIAKMLNNLAEANAAKRAEEERQARAERLARVAERARAAEEERAERPRAAVRDESAASPRTGNPDMDRFLAEIDRLRRRSTPPSAVPVPPAGSSSSPPVIQPVKTSERPRPRVVAELAEPAPVPAPPPPPPIPTFEAPPPTPPAPPPLPSGFGTSPQAPVRETPTGGQIEKLPVAPVVRTPATTGAPATSVTRLPARPRPAARTNFAKNLAALLGTGQGAAMAVVMQEILGPPKCKRKRP
ncbi:MAG: hypothetical protein RMJ56_17435 [Gemmataceae bacterium]|nr:hypothetical protein [Gemmata sp.]MDW8199380.1 hypothetical protein [Gemmataceae bacterium]